MSLYEFLFNHPFPGSARHEAFVKERRKRGRRRRRRSSTNKRLRGLEEDQICRRVVEEAGEDSGEPEEVRGTFKPQIGAVGLEDRQGYLHAEEDADEERGEGAHGDEDGPQRAVADDDGACRRHLPRVRVRVRVRVCVRVPSWVSAAVCSSPSPLCV